MSDVTERKQSTQPQARQGGEVERRSETAIRPAGDIFEHADGITILLDMPGVSKERLDINTDRNSLVVEGEIQIDLPKEMESLYADVRNTHYRRAFSLSGEQLDTNGVEATLKNGVLRINIPKREEVRPRKIEVKAS
ncbi:MAG: Hsp20/alpha crystallin family protein [Pseudomonadales bacterium]